MVPIALVVGELTAYLSVNKDNYKRGVDEARRDLGNLERDAGRASDGVASKTERMVSTVAAAVEKSRRVQEDAASRVAVAEKRLEEARAKGGQRASVLLALENQLAQAKYKLADANAAAASSTGKLADAQKALASEVEKMGQQTGPAAQKAGEQAGGKLAQGMEMALTRNAPLIAAAVAAASAAGAPGVLAGATALFSGIGVVAAAQSDRVQSAWMGTWDVVRTGTIQAASVIEPTLVRLAARVAAGFELLRPRLAGIFADAAPQIEVFAEGLFGLASHALPGLERAVGRSMPVMQGLSSFMEQVGDGLTRFFDAISAHAPEAGAAFAGLGGVIGNLLPILGEILGQGAEVAAVMLPALAGALGMVARLLDTVGGAIPAVLTGLMAMKVAGSVGTVISNLGEKLVEFGGRSSLASIAAGKVGPAISGIGTAAAAGGPLVMTLAAATGLLMAAHQQSEDQIRTWTAALNAGGDGAAAARAEMVQYDENVRTATTGIVGFAASMTLAGPALQGLKNDTADAKAANEAYLESLGPLGRAQRDVTIAEKELSDAIAQHGPHSDEAAAATKRYEAAQADAERIAGELQTAINGVTDAMVAQTEQAMAAIDSGFAYERSLNTMEDAQAALNEAIKEYGPNSEEASRAQLALKEDTYAVAQAFGRQQADLSGLEAGTAGYTRYLQENTLKRLYELHSAAGPETKAAIGQQIQALEASGVSLSNVGTLAMDASGKMQYLGAQRPTPVVGANVGQFDAATSFAMNRMAILSYTHATPTVRAIADVYNAERHLNWVARNRRVTIWTNTITDRKAGGPVIAAANGRKVTGPGGPTDDLIPAIGPGGAQYRLSNTEWIINAMVSRRQGDAKMAAFNAGLMDLVPKDDRKVRGFAYGGSPSQVMTQPSASVSRGWGDVVININGTFDLASSRDLRRAARVMESELVALGRERS